MALPKMVLNREDQVHFKLQGARSQITFNPASQELLQLDMNLDLKNLLQGLNMMQSSKQKTITILVLLLT